MCRILGLTFDASSTSWVSPPAWLATPNKIRDVYNFSRQVESKNPKVNSDLLYMVQKFVEKKQHIGMSTINVESINNLQTNATDAR